MNIMKSRAVSRAQSDAIKARALTAQWEARAEKGRADLEALRADAGRLALDAEDGGVSVAKRIRDLSDEIDLATRAVAESAVRRDAAVARALRVEAEAMQPEIDRVRAKRQAHVDQVAKLLEQLNTFANDDYRPWEVRRDDVMRAGAAGIERPWPIEDQILKNEIEPLERAQAALFAAADGVNPLKIDGITVEDLSDSIWGENAFAPLPQYISRKAERLAELARLERELEDVRSRIAMTGKPAPGDVGAVSDASSLAHLERNLTATIGAEREKLAALR